MSCQSRLLAFGMILSTAALGAARFSGEKGTRPHRTRLSAGQFHTCAVLDDGTVQCWGRNTYGQLGDGTVTTRLSPVPVTNLGTAISIAAGSLHTCAILSSGTVRCWGFNDYGQLGNGTTASSGVPVAVTGLTNIVSLAAGFLHTCAVRVDGTVWCWGAAIANGSAGGSLVPVQVTLSGAVSVTAGASHSCALTADSLVWCWGQNGSGQAGYYGGMVTHSNPAPVTTRFYTLDGVLEVSAGSSFTCARLRDGSVNCWGDNSQGQFGDGTIAAGTPYPTPSDLPSRVVALTTGGAHTCAILIDGTVNCFGVDFDGQLGYPEFYGNNLYPNPPVPAITNAVEITAGEKHTCAAISDGTIRCWGDNTHGQHGDGISGQVGIDTVAGISGTFLGRGVTAGNQYSCGRRGTGASACWGAGAQGQLGDSANASSSNPVAVTGLSNSIAVAAGNLAHACSLDAAGIAKCWGDNSRGQLGNGTTIRSNQPVAVLSNEPFSAISTGDLHTCAITAQGIARCWGAGDHGQLGTLGTLGTADSSVPVAVNGLSRVVAIAAGNKFTCALNSEGRVFCWGDNSLGQLGTGATGAPAGRADVGLVNIVAIAAGADHVCAVSAFGSVLCWGSNSRGQIGNNSTNPALVPTTVSGLTDAVSISAGAFFTCAVQAAGTASCWGANDSGELSAVDSLDHLTPTPVGNFRICLFCSAGIFFSPLSGVVSIATGTNTSLPTKQHACALLANGVIDCWGNNAQGEVGNGTTTNQPRPTAVNSFLANVDPAATLRNDRIAEVTALINCQTGDQSHITLTLEQGASRGTGHAEARCDGRLLQVPMSIPAQGPFGFQPGPATAHVEAIVRKEGAILDDTHWTKGVVLSVTK